MGCHRCMRCVNTAKWSNCSPVVYMVRGRRDSEVGLASSGPAISSACGIKTERGARSAGGRDPRIKHARRRRRAPQGMRLGPQPTSYTRGRPSPACCPDPDWLSRGVACAATPKCPASRKRGQRQTYHYRLWVGPVPGEQTTSATCARAPRQCRRIPNTKHRRSCNGLWSQLACAARGRRRGGAVVRVAPACDAPAGSSPRAPPSPIRPTPSFGPGTRQDGRQCLPGPHA